MRGSEIDGERERGRGGEIEGERGSHRGHHCCGATRVGEWAWQITEHSLLGFVASASSVHPSPGAIELCRPMSERQ